MTVITAKSTLDKNGIAEKYMTNDGLQFTSAEFRTFVLEWDFKHTISNPIYSQTNGQAESRVHTVKTLLSKTLSKARDICLALFV